MTLSTGCSVFSLIALLAVGGHAAADQETPLTVESAVRQALQWHPAIDVAVGQVRQSREDIAVARSGYYPSVRAGSNSRYRRSGSGGGWEPEFNITATQLLYDFGKVGANVDMATAGEKVSEARLALATDNLIRDTAGALIEVQRYRALVQAARTQVASIRSVARLVSERAADGASTLSEKVQADARVESALGTQLRYQSELNRWQTALTQLVGGKGMPTLSTEVPRWLLGVCERAEPDWSQVPKLLEAQFLKARAEAELERRDADRMPTISLEAGSNYYPDGMPLDRDEKTEHFVGVNVSSELYSGGRISAARRGAAQALQSAEAALRNARYETERALRESGSQIGMLERLESSLDARINSMETTRALYRDQYFSLGSRSLLDLLNSEQELYEARFQSINAVHDIRGLNLTCLYDAGILRKKFNIEAQALRGEE